MSASSARHVDEATRLAQQRASDPLASAWVAANAGSGKTYVLSRRVIRLLLAGAEPGRILCLTFTKAAAAEMAKRVFDALARWTALPDAPLAAEIAEMEGRPPDARRLAFARRLFARALETPGGLKIQTIHAFCERLLHQFPLEANVPGHFEVLDERAGALLQEEARRRVLEAAGRDPAGPLGAALRTVLAAASDQTYEEALAEFVARRDPIRRWIAAAGSLDAALGELRAALSLGAGDTVETLRARIIAEAHFDRRDFQRLLDLLSASGKETDRKAAGRLAPFFAAAGPDEEIAACLDFFTTSDGAFRKPGSLVTKAVKDRWPDLADRLEAEIGRLERLFERISAAGCFRDTAALLTLADAAIAAYEAAKQRRGVLDFEDLIVRTVSLLSRSEAARWVQYKLDRGLNHILVDEAQDTSPRQWQVITDLTGDFFAGAGAGTATRTFFAVGDEKQSIFSFQGSVPAWFARIRAEIGRRARQASYVFDEIGLHLSFRSAPIILDAVDTVFAAEAARAGVVSGGGWPPHTAARHAAPGRVVVWPMIAPPPAVEPADWTAPLDRRGEESPEIVLAERIAATIGGWLEGGERLESGEAIRPGGILVLARSRGLETAAIHRALKRRGIPFAGADRLRLTGHIAVMDLLALGEAMLLPEDDLTLAALLKSPLIGLDEDALFRLACGRQGSLWDALGRAAKAEGGLFAATRRRLAAWRAQADFVTPHAFFAGVLGRDRGRQAFLRRLGAEAEDVLDEFLAQTLLYEQAETPSLQGFVAWLEADPTDIKRDTDMLRDEVRVMTVHGAKGLEADIVFLVDTGAAPVHQSHVPRVIALGDENAAPPPPLVWLTSTRAAPAVVAGRIDELKERAREEYRRLLYVAMTRAKDRLYVAGIDKKVPEEDRSRRWHALIASALEPGSRRIEDGGGNLVALDWRAPGAAPAGEGATPSPRPEIAIPDWARTAAPPHPAPVARLSPSSLEGAAGLGAASALAVGLDQERDAALRRGRLVHRLLQSLPDHPPADRHAAGTGFLDAVAGDLDADWRAGLLAEVLAILGDPAFAAVFGEGSRAEVEIAGTVATETGEAAVSGRIDRLAVTPGRILIVDYKTNRPAPAELAAVPPAYVAQLALYRLVLARLYPGRPVAAAILWTDRPALMEIPAGTLDSAVSAIARP